MTRYEVMLTVCLIAASSIFSSLLQAADPPALRLGGQPNFRDIGGFKTRHGKTVKRGLVYRSGELPRLSHTIHTDS